MGCEASGRVGRPDLLLLWRATSDGHQSSDVSMELEMSGTNALLANSEGAERLRESARRIATDDDARAFREACARIVRAAADAALALSAVKRPSKA